MHGLINRSIQCFVREMHGDIAWRDITDATGSNISDYEALSFYPDEETENLIETAVVVLRKPRPRLLEDLGTWLITTSSDTSVRRLLRFCGCDYEDFLVSLSELPGRARMAVEGLNLPSIELREGSSKIYTMTLTGSLPGFCHVFVGILQGMADEYGALAVIEVTEVETGLERLAIMLFATDYTEGSQFQLVAG